MERIIEALKKGFFDQNPRLCRRVVCGKCGNAGKRIVDFLKIGQYEVAKTEQIVVRHAEFLQAYPYKYERLPVTPIEIKTVCEKCGHKEVVRDAVLTIEYLSGISERKEPRITYT
jgi:hypothetical protein